MDVKKFLEELSNNWDSLLPSLKQKALQDFNIEKKINFKEKKVEGIPNTFGVYLFKIEPAKDFDINKFNKHWKTNKTIKCPNIIKSNCNTKAKKSPFNLYLGKSEKLSSRIHEHCFHDKKKTTYGLKLAHRKELLKSKITVSYFALDDISDYTENKEVLQFIITNLEKSLRKELKPWIGKQ